MGHPSGGFTYTYDRFSNRHLETVTAGSGIQPEYTFNANNQVINNNTYDAAGNVTNDGPGIGNSYTYDAENRIITASNGYSASYVYDAFGHRVRSTVNGVAQDFLYDLNGRTIDQYTGGAPSRSEAYAGGQHIATYVSGTPYFDSSDWLSTFRARTNTSGDLVESCISLPFGEDLTCSVALSAEVSPLHFTGQEHDAESGNEHFPFRYYSETMGKFLTPDPAGLAAVDPSNPQSWNRYAYALNNPLSYTDPLGLWCVWEDGTHDDDESDGGASAGDCADQGGHWDQFDNITGIFQQNGMVTQISSVWGTSNLGPNSGFSLSDFDTSLASYQDTTVTVGQFDNTVFNPFHHAAIQIGNGPFYGQAPRSTLAFLLHFVFGSPNTPGVPGTIEVQNPNAMTNAITFPVSGAQAGIIQSDINQSLQNPPPYDVYGPTPTCDCAFWIQNVLGDAGFNTGAPTIYPTQLLWQLQQAIP